MNTPSPSTARTPPIRALVTKIGFDGHDRGSRLVATFLKDAGMEVIYTPPWQSIEAVIKLAIEEDIDVIGVSSLATDHLIVPDLMAALDAADLRYVKVLVGGIVPEADHAALHDAGVVAVFGPGAGRDDIVAAFEEHAHTARQQKHAAFAQSV